MQKETLSRGVPAFAYRTLGQCQCPIYPRTIIHKGFTLQHEKQSKENIIKQNITRKRIPQNLSRLTSTKI